MEINYKKDMNVIEFSELCFGDVFSYSDYSGLYLVTDSGEAFDFSTESFVDFHNDEKVIRREISITIIDGLPHRE